MTLSKTDDFRYERKFFVSEMTIHQVDTMVKLHPAMFSEIYYPRYVNNLYLDSFTMKNYFDNVDGIRDRLKVRIRWYGDIFGLIEKPVLELKIKKGLVGRKESYPLPPFSVCKCFQRDTITQLFERSGIPQALKLDLTALEGALLNRYRRKYFLSANRKYRVTIDSEMEFYRLRATNNTFLNKSVDLRNIVVELKYDPEDDRGVEQITNHFPVRLTRSSKYVNGLDRVYA